MPTNTPNIIQQTQTTQQPIILQPAQQIVQQTATPKKKIVVKSLNWSTKGTNTRNANPDLETKVKELFEEVRENLSHLRQLNNALMSAEYFDMHYKKEHQGKEAEYKEVLSKINELSRKPKDESTVTELKIISDVLSLDRAYIDAIFPQIINEAISLNNSMSIEVNDIHYENLHERANLALKRLNAIEEQLNLDDKVGDLEDQTTSISSAILIINNFNDMQELKQEILALKKQDLELAKNTTKNFLIGVAIIVLSFFIITFILYKYDVHWDDFKDEQIASIGIPLGVCIWSFLGSFAAMLIQFYQKPIHEFGNMLKWVLIRPLLGVVMGCAIYLALYSLVLTGKSQNELLPFLVAFFVGYSDSFTFALLGSIQTIVVSLFTSSKPEDIKNNPLTQQPVYIMTTPMQPAAVITPNTTATAEPNSIEKTVTTTTNDNSTADSEHTDTSLPLHPTSEDLGALNEDEND